MSPRPARAQTVVLRLPGADDDLAARVDQADDDVITLVLAVTPSASVDRLRDEPAVVEYTTPRGVYRLSGQVAGQGESPEIIRVRRDGQFDVTQRRDFVRVDAVMPLHVTITDPVRGVAQTTTLNVSGGGLLVHDPFGLPFGAQVDIELELAPGSAKIQARGTVVREAGPEAKGVQIDAIGADDRERLVRYVLERERMALRVAREG